MNIGIIGLGDMGLLYACSFAEAGFKVLGCDLPDRIAKLRSHTEGHDIILLEDGREVSRQADIIFYSVEAEKIDAVVQQYGPFTKRGAIVAGQTSVKHPEIHAFEKYLPANVHIVTCHSLHSPMISPAGQKLIVIPYRTTEEAYRRMVSVLSVLGSQLSEMTDYHYHDKIVADTQAVTHFGFESMGTAWMEAGFFPWENGSYLGGIDNIKILTMLRIFSAKAHIYAGLALLNPYVPHQVAQYARSESELFKLMIMEEERAFRKRIYSARDFVFGKQDQPILLSETVIKEFSLSAGTAQRKANSHLSLLSMVDAWHHLQVNPYENLICQTPPFRLRLGIAELLFKDEELLEESIAAAVFDRSIRADDLEFHSAVREWATLIIYGDMSGYKQHFDKTKAFFSDRLDQGRLQSAALMRKLAMD